MPGRDGRDRVVLRESPDLGEHGDVRYVRGVPELAEIVRAARVDVPASGRDRGVRASRGDGDDVGDALGTRGSGRRQEEEEEEEEEEDVRGRAARAGVRGEEAGLGGFARASR